MIKVILKKIRSNHNNLRTDTIEGYIKQLPEIGDCVVLTGESLTSSEGLRLVYTTPIVEFASKTDSYMEFKTRNSEYSLEVLSVDNNS